MDFNIMLPTLDIKLNISCGSWQTQRYGNRHNYDNPTKIAELFKTPGGLKANINNVIEIQAYPSSRFPG